MIPQPSPRFITKGIAVAIAMVSRGALAHQAVMHVHLHINPKYDEGSGLGIDWPARVLDKVDAAELAESIASELTD